VVSRSAGAVGGTALAGNGNSGRSARTAITATTMAITVANRVGPRIPAGSREPAAARSAITDVGIRVMQEVLSARNSACASLAVPLCGLSLSSSSMARMPNGVAALPSPNALADRFSTIAPIAGWSGGTSLNARVISGRMILAMTVSRPASSATFIRPRNSARMPISPIASMTERSAASIMAAVSAAIGVPPPKSSFAPATATDTRTRPRKTRFKRPSPPVRRGARSRCGSRTR